jgi:hypothetical protein
VSHHAFIAGLITPKLFLLFWGVTIIGDVCNFGKHTKLYFKLSNCNSNEPFVLVHSDVSGPAPIDSYNGYKYFIIFIDDYSKATGLYLMKNKSEVISHF